MAGSSSELLFTLGGLLQQVCVLPGVNHQAIKPLHAACPPAVAAASVLVPTPCCALPVGAQLEAAQGGVDPEARTKMDLLRQQLGALDQARERASAVEAEARASSRDAGAAVQPKGAASSLTGGVADNAAAMLQQMEG